jgi:hypothetical protein
MDIIIKIYFIMIIFVLITIIIKLYTVIHHGKLIIKAKKIFGHLWGCVDYIIGFDDYSFGDIRVFKL